MDPDKDYSMDINKFFNNPMVRLGILFLILFIGVFIIGYFLGQHYGIAYCNEYWQSYVQDKYLVLR